MTRWTPQKKRALLLLVSDLGDEIAEQHAVSQEELAEWRRAYNARGLAGLCVTKRDGRCGATKR